MGQQQSHEPPDLEIRVEDPAYEGTTLPPKGLALIAHGRFGGTMDQPLVRQLAYYFLSERCLRVVTWNARGMGNSGGKNEWGDLGSWIGVAGVEDYNVSVSLASLACGLAC